MMRSTGEHIAAPHQDRFLHCTSAGNRGQQSDDTRFSHWNSPFTMASHFATPQEMAPIGDHTVAEVANLVLYAQQVYASTPSAQSPLTNVVVVGNSDYAGAKAPESCEPSDVRVLGDDIYNVCAVAEIAGGDAGCQVETGELRAKYSGTSMATPQVTGLAAYLWNLRPELTVSEVISTIINNFHETDPMIPGRVDAYQCVTSLDHSLADSPIRRELFDVAGTTPVPGSNRSFDENDLQLYFDQFRAIQEARENQTGRTYDNSRYDLNGNGITTIDSLWIDYETQRFDLDVNSPPYYALEVAQTIERQNIKYNETELSDLDILCYYAYSPLYSGDEQKRTELCLPCLGEFELQLNIANEIHTGQPELLTVKLVRKPSADVTLNAPGVTITVDVLDGVASIPEGTTDNNGEFTTEISADGTQQEVEIHVEAFLNDVLVDSLTIAPSVVAEATVTITDWNLSYKYSHFVQEWDGTVVICDRIDNEDVVQLPLIGHSENAFASQAGPCTTDEGATCNLMLDANYQTDGTATDNGSSAVLSHSFYSNHSGSAKPSTWRSTG
ncbi:MAG: S8 family serine peptidase [bacterium]|nr:S8 family serine peptidase [bacterium]